MSAQSSLAIHSASLRFGGQSVMEAQSVAAIKIGRLRRLCPLDETESADRREEQFRF
jgi:hypothetical protein